MIFELQGDPIPKKRHRYHVAGSKIISYNPQFKLDNEIRNRLLIKLQSALNSDDKKEVMEASNLALSDLFEVQITFFLPICQSLISSKRNILNWFPHHNGKPDLDNLCKFYLDAANGVLWPDDRKIFSLNVIKYYSNNPRTVIEVIGRRRMDLPDKLAGILGLFSPEEVELFLDEMNILTERFGCNLSDKEDKSKKAIIAAYFLSKVADEYGERLAKIHKKYPEAWKEYEEAKLSV